MSIGSAISRVFSYIWGLWGNASSEVKEQAIKHVLDIVKMLLSEYFHKVRAEANKDVVDTKASS